MVRLTSGGFVPWWWCWLCWTNYLSVYSCMLCIFTVVVKCITYKVLKWMLSVIIVYNFLHQFSSFRDNWQEMVTEEVKSIFRKANRQVDKPKIWEAQGRMLKLTKKERHMTSCMRDTKDNTSMCVSLQLTKTTLIGLIVVCLIRLCPAQQKQQR